MRTYFRFRSFKRTKKNQMFGMLLRTRTFLLVFIRGYDPEQDTKQSPDKDQELDPEMDSEKDQQLSEMLNH